MPPRPSLQSLPLMAVAAGDFAPLLLAAAAAAGGSASGCSTPSPGAASQAARGGLLRLAVRSRNVHSAEVYKKDCEARLGQLIERLKKEGINPKQWRLGTFQRMLCPMCKGGSTEELSLSVFIPMDGKNATWNCFRANCGWKGYVQPDGASKVSQAKKKKHRK